MDVGLPWFSAFCAGLHSVSHAADPRYPDWPCVQAKVPEISVAAVWDGPPIEQAADTWQSDSAIKDMVARLAARRTPMEEAQKSIAEFLSGDAAAKADKGKRLFAGIVRDAQQRAQRRHQRTRTAGAQRESACRADQVRTLRDARIAGPSAPDQSKIDEFASRIEWSTRIFEDRRRSIRYACEVPVIIEKRLFALSRTIQQTVEP